MSTSKTDKALAGPKTAKLEHASPFAEPTSSNTIEIIGDHQKSRLQLACANAEAASEGATIAQRLPTDRQARIPQSQIQAEQAARNKNQNLATNLPTGSPPTSKGSNNTRISEQPVLYGMTPGAIRIGPHGFPMRPNEERSDDNLASESRHTASSDAAKKPSIHVVPADDVERVEPNEQQWQDKGGNAQYRTTSQQQPPSLAIMTEQSDSVNITPPVDMKMNREGHLDGKYPEHLERDPLMCCCINCDCCRHCCPKCASFETTRDKVRCCVCCSMCCFMPVWLCGIDI